MTRAGACSILVFDRTERMKRMKLVRCPSFASRCVPNMMAAVCLLAAATAASALGPATASAAPKSVEGVVIPKPTGKLLQVGEGVSVRLETGWIVGALYPAALSKSVPATHRHGPYAELYRNSPRAVLYVFADGYGVKSTPSKLLPVVFSEWSHGWLVQRHVGKVDAFSLGSGGPYNSGAVVGFSGTEAATSGASAHPVRGIALLVVNSSTGHAASVYSIAEPANYTPAVQGQVEGMADSVVSPAND